MRREYATMEADVRLYTFIGAMDARASLRLFKFDTYDKSVENNDKPSLVEGVHSVYDLYNNKHKDLMDSIDGYVVDHLRFDIDGVTIVVKPHRWARV